MKLTRLFGRQRRSDRAAQTSATQRKCSDWAPRLERLEPRDTPSVAYTVSTTGDALLRFDTTAPSVTTSVGVSGLLSGEVLDGIDFRTQTGQLFAVAVNNSTHVARLGTIDVSTGTFTAIGSSINLGSGATVSITDDPVNDRLILVTDTGVSLTINPNTAAVTTNTDIAGDLAGIAFNNNFQGATSATLFGIDVANNTLVTVNTGTGVTTTVGGGLGVGNVSAVGGLAIQSDGTALADLTVGGVSGLYSINLGTGVATKIGNISGRDRKSVV